MDTQTSDKLSHEEAFELLPWHINATLDETLSDRVAHHVEQCSTCQEETAILSNTILALNTGDAVTTNLDARFSRVLGRVRDFEQGNEAARRQSSLPLGQRIVDWLGLSESRLQWASAFVLGLAVGIGALLVTMQSGQVDPTLMPVYETHASGQMPLQLRVEFDEPPGATVLAEIERSIGASGNWQRQSDTLYLVELSDELTIKAVADVRSRLLSNDSVVTVAIDIGNAEID